MSEGKLDLPKAGSVITLTGFGKDGKFLLQNIEATPHPLSINGPPFEVKLELLSLPTTKAARRASNKRFAELRKGKR